MSEPGNSVLDSAHGPSRREVLRAGGLGGLGLALSSRGLLARERSPDRAVILLMLVGGPSSHETFDPKPEAPAEVRGPFRSIATRVPGIRVSEHLPRLAQCLDQVTIVRGLTHDAAPIHETGFQLLQTGGLSRSDQEERPHFGAVASHALAAGRARPFVVLPGPIESTGVNISHGQTAGSLGSAHGPAFRSADCAPHGEPLALREAYGSSQRFGACCLKARRLVEAGARAVVVNMYSTVFNQPSWDCHGHGPFATFEDYRRVVLPAFDRGFSALVEDLRERGLLETTLVVATGEFGRTPRVNAHGGRDHWTGAWSALIAGGGGTGGRAIGATDAHGAEPIDGPIGPVNLLATIHEFLGIDPTVSIALKDGSSRPVLDGARPIPGALA